MTTLTLQELTIMYDNLSDYGADGLNDNNVYDYYDLDTNLSYDSELDLQANPLQSDEEYDAERLVDSAMSMSDWTTNTADLVGRGKHADSYVEADYNWQEISAVWKEPGDVPSSIRQPDSSNNAKQIFRRPSSARMSYYLSDEDEYTSATHAHIDHELDKALQQDLTITTSTDDSVIDQMTPKESPLTKKKKTASHNASSSPRRRPRWMQIFGCLHRAASPLHHRQGRRGPTRQASF